MTLPQLLLNRYHWRSSSCGILTVTGRVFYQRQLANADTLADLLLNDKREFNTELIGTLSGFFAIVIKNEDSLILVTDRVRSFPLFYHVSDQRLCVSDDCMSLSSAIQPDDVIAREFTALGYVTGNDTLFNRTKQVPAGTITSFCAHGIREERYFVFKRTTEQIFQSEAQIMQRLHCVMSSVVEECIKLAAGRQIVVPLSGGYDSRAILLFLKKAGYENILTFTFGAASSPEIAVAGQLARELNVRWVPVIYTARMWCDLRQDVEFSRYLQFVSNGVSVPNIQMWPAIRTLLRQDCIESDALILPGHTGDFISGGHLSGDTTMVDYSGLQDIALSIYQKYYQLDKLPVSQPLLNRIMTVCKELLEHKPAWTVEDLQDTWNWQERQSKFIVNSNRYYEFFNLEWWLPFWQREFVSFWLQVPKSMLRQQKLWRNFVDLECQRMGLSATTGNAVQMKKVPIFLDAGLNYFFDRNLLLWFVPFRYWLLYRLGISKHSGTLNSYLARLMLRRTALHAKISEN